MANQVLTLSLTPTLDFADVSGALEYWAQIATDPRFATISQQQTGLATSQFTATTLADAKKYFWRFRTRTSAAIISEALIATTSGSGNNLRDDPSTTGLAQGFKTAYTLPVKQVALRLKRTGTPGNNVWVEIWTDSGGIPSAQTGGDSATVAVDSGIGTSFAAITFTFSTPIALTKGTQYYVVLQGDYVINGIAIVTWEHTGSNSYADGGPWKHNASVVFTANGTSDQLVTLGFGTWGAWSPIWSFWVDSGAEIAVTPTGYTYIDPDLTTDAYTFAVAPLLLAGPENILRGSERNLAGKLLSEYVTTMANLVLDFQDGYVADAQLAEILRFYQMRKAVYLITMRYNGADTVENIYKVEFDEPPDFEPIAAGRLDYFRGGVKHAEAAFT